MFINLIQMSRFNPLKNATLALVVALLSTACMPEGNDPNQTSENPYSSPSPLSLQSASFHIDEIQHNSKNTVIEGYSDFSFQSLDIRELPKEFDIELTLVELEITAQNPKRWPISKTTLSGDLLNERINEPFRFEVTPGNFPTSQANTEIAFSIKPKNDFRVYGPMFGKSAVKLKSNAGSIGNFRRFKSKDDYSSYMRNFIQDQTAIQSLRTTSSSNQTTAILKPLIQKSISGRFKTIVHYGGEAPRSNINGVLEIELKALNTELLPGEFNVRLVLIERENSTQERLWFLAETQTKANLVNEQLKIDYDFTLTSRIPHDQSSVEILYFLDPVQKLNQFESLSGIASVVLGVPGQVKGTLERFDSSSQFESIYEALIGKTGLPSNADPRFQVQGERHGFTISDLRVTQSRAISQAQGTDWPNAYEVFVELEITDSLKKDQSKTTASHPFDVNFLGSTQTAQPLPNSNRLKAGPFELRFDPFAEQQVITNQSIVVRSTSEPYFAIQKTLQTQLIPWEKSLFHYNQGDFRNNQPKVVPFDSKPKLTMHQLRYGYLGAKEFKVDREMNMVQMRRYWIHLEPRLLRPFQYSGAPKATPIHKGSYEVKFVVLGRKQGVSGNQNRTQDERLTGSTQDVLEQYEYLGSHKRTVQSQDGVIKLDQLTIPFSDRNYIYVASRCLLLVEVKPIGSMSNIEPFQFTSTFYPMHQAIQVPIFEADRSSTQIEKTFLDARLSLDEIITQGELTYLKLNWGDESSFDLFRRISGIPYPTRSQLEALRTYNGRVYQDPDAKKLRNLIYRPQSAGRKTVQNLCNLWDEPQSDTQDRDYWLDEDDQFRCKRNPFDYFQIERILHVSNDPTVIGSYTSHGVSALRSAQMNEHAHSQVKQEGDRFHFVRLGTSWDAITGHVFGRGVLLSAGGGWEYYSAKFTEFNLRERNQNQSVLVSNFHTQELRLDLELEAIRCIVVTQIKPLPTKNRLHICQANSVDQIKPEKIQLAESWYFITPERAARFDALADRSERSWFQIIRGRMDFQLWTKVLGRQTADAPVLYLEPLPLHIENQENLTREFRAAQNHRWSDVRRDLTENDQVMANGTMSGQIRRPLTWKPGLNRQ